jgi:hypothetical protein
MGAGLTARYSPAPVSGLTLAVKKPAPPAPRPPRLLDRVRAGLRVRHCSRRTEKAYRAILLYGAGLRLLEGARLRVKDVDFSANQIVVRDGKGHTNRVTMLLPLALARKYPTAGREWAWQWVFPATRHYVDLATGQRRRHHLHEPVIQRAVKEAVRQASIARPASCHTLRVLLRDPPPRGRPRHPDGAGAPRPQRRQHDHDLHARSQPWPGGSPEPGRSVARPVSLALLPHLASSAVSDRRDRCIRSRLRRRPRGSERLETLSRPLLGPLQPGYADRLRQSPPCYGVRETTRSPH